MNQSVKGIRLSSQFIKLKSQTLAFNPVTCCELIFDQERSIGKCFHYMDQSIKED